MIWNSDIILKFPKRDLQQMFVIEMCPCCDCETIAWSHGVTKCQHCGVPIAPCGVCMDERGRCDYSKCPYGCNGTDDDLEKEITMPDIIFDSVEACEILYSIL
jgi:hypothetical protein